jgi:hypothetical protein
MWTCWSCCSASAARYNAACAHALHHTLPLAASAQATSQWLLEHTHATFLRLWRFLLAANLACLRSDVLQILPLLQLFLSGWVSSPPGWLTVPFVPHSIAVVVYIESCCSIKPCTESA